MSYLTLEPSDGPPCPRCGCQDVKIQRLPPAGQESWFDGGRARCRHCGLSFSFRQLPQDPPAPPPDVPPTKPRRRKTVSRESPA